MLPNHAVLCLGDMVFTLERSQFLDDVKRWQEGKKKPLTFFQPFSNPVFPLSPLF